jgi:hypothetical protein
MDSGSVAAQKLRRNLASRHAIPARSECRALTVDLGTLIAAIRRIGRSRIAQ